MPEVAIGKGISFALLIHSFNRPEKLSVTV